MQYIRDPLCLISGELSLCRRLYTKSYFRWLSNEKYHQTHTSLEVHLLNGKMHL